VGSLLDGFNDGFVDFLLVSRARCRDGLFLQWLSRIKELLFGSLLHLLIFCKVRIVELAQIHARDINLGRGGDDISGVDAAEWNSIDFKWASDKKDTL